MVHLKPGWNCSYLAGQSEPASLSMLRNEAEAILVLVDPSNSSREVALQATSSSATDLSVSVSAVGWIFTNHTSRYSPSGGGWRSDPLLPLDNGRWSMRQCPRSMHLVSAPHGLGLGLMRFVPSRHVCNDHSCLSLVRHLGFDGIIADRWSMPSRNFSDFAYLKDRGVRHYAVLNINHELSGVPQETGYHIKLKGDCPSVTDADVQRALADIESLLNELRAAGAADPAYIYGWDESPASCEPEIRKMYGAIKAQFPDLPLVATLNWKPMPVDLPVDVWVLQYEYFEASAAKAWVAAGKQQWQYHCIEPSSSGYLNTFIEHDLVEARLLMWLAAANELEYQAPTGWLSFTDFPAANYIWSPRTDIFANGDGYFMCVGASPSGRLVGAGSKCKGQAPHLTMPTSLLHSFECRYPGEAGPLRSMRLAALRDGLEDWEFFQQNKDTLASLRTIVRGPTDFNSVRATNESLLAFTHQTRARSDAHSRAGPPCSLWPRSSAYESNCWRNLET
ncbi:uncharacterized protein MONBRDRAFT_9044 [Monosiga brevicollis MX1]|uniref:Glycoside hydrolase 123 catalytic domain-containing protein n=1 Tax=Monosiga brevicollis TaxID=81824 RepID=A9V1X2_MONBE|nr:uncharacterized protein MONBRDRAFT_9044 [Monosiga brevicollis MX1]EDQ88638.1 predicted protein [Monosiga brevicollis MX1]|eukprot:XP_001746742.1 hypothetical protein [Monosiga brevicollis MX1]